MYGPQDNKERIIVHRINDNLDEEGHAFKTSEEFPNITDTCEEPETTITCDMHYELDWYYRLRYEGTCGTVEADDPCFATSACVCSNGYYRLSESMPERPEDLPETGLEEVLETVVEV